MLVMKSTLAIIAISAVLLSGLVFLPGVNMNAYSQQAQPAQQAPGQSAGKNVSVVYQSVEKNLTLPDGQLVKALTWNGTIPGPTVRLTQGDTVHVTINNPSNNTLIHS